MQNVKLIIEYDGTEYSGWQIQENSKTIQGEIQEALYKITGEKINTIGAGRTDAGVHAKGQTANFITASEIKGEQFSWALNSVLKEDIVIRDSIEVPIDFHSCYDAKSKIYSYTLYMNTFPPAIMRNYMYHIKRYTALNVSNMEKAANYFVGTHDFKGFMASGSNVKNTVRTIYNIKLQEDEDRIKITYHGNGFLYKMIRIITGTIIYSGIGKIDADSIPEILATGKRELAGSTAPARGLCLEKVIY